MHEKSRYQNFYETKKGSSTQCFSTVTQRFRRRIVIPPPPHLLSLTFFDIRNFSESHKGSPVKFFGAVRQKTFRRIVISPSPSFAYNIEISGGIDVCRKPLKTRFKTAVSFSTVCKCRSKYL